MNNKKILIPGWNGKFDINSLFMFKVGLNRKDIEASVLNYYIKKGEYNSTFPLGILKLAKEYYLITSNESFPKKTFRIKNYLGEILDTTLYDVVYDHLALEAFFYSLIDSIYIQKGFENPNSIRTFLGKSAKGKLSDRRHLIREIILHDKIYDTKLKIYKSVNHEVFLDEKDFMISCLPNYEIYGNFLDLPLSNTQRSKLEDEELYKSIIYMTPDEFIKRFNEYKNFVLKELEIYKFINFVQENKPQESNKVERNNVFRINPLNYDIFINNENSFEIQMLDIIKAKANELPSINIHLLIDVYNLDENLLYPKEIENYIFALRKVPFFNVQGIQNFNLIEDIQFHDEENYLILINDKSPGSTYIYDYCKKNSSISKIIKSHSTLHKIFNYLEHLLLIWLSFNFRLKKKLVWSKTNPSLFKRIISFNVFRDNDFNYLKLAGIILNQTNHTIEEIKQVFLLPNNNVINTRDISKAIIKSLKYDFNIPNKSDFYIFTEMRYTQSLINYIECVAPVALISQPYARILSQDNNSVNIPENGIYSKIFQNQYLLITTGKPDYSGLGIPNPLQIKFNNKNIRDLDENYLLQLIYDLTFYQQLSFSKKSLPFLIPMNNKLLFKKIALKYNEVEPF